ncbi:Cullin family-domain-containing protein [Rhodocollybia butyracea]|uniref:Cullin family-domain-containing protein n=1 Tax=Rhodocollybia butyracea TaxID=206335 RepID=A0A9P5P749_9AGAR|nr:Cullin family-domain-containing protein [Rhodocollybia butyracea]
MNVFSLLELPVTSTGFSAISKLDYGDRIGKQLHKVARTDTDIDSASASRSGTVLQSGITRIRISGGQIRTNVLEDSFHSIRHNISVILTPFERPEMSESYEAVSLRAQYIVCVERKGEMLYNNLRKELDACMERKILPGLLKQDVKWIEYMSKLFDWFHDAVALLQSLLSFLDTVGTQSIKSLAYSVFNDRILGRIAVAQKLRDSLTTWTSADRQNSEDERASRASVGRLLRHLITHDVFYGSDGYEKFLITATEEYYSVLATILTDDMHEHPAEFFDTAYDLVEAEVERAEQVFPIDSRQAIREVTERSLFLLPHNLEQEHWVKKVRWLTTAEAVKGYVDNGRIEVLGRMYRVFNRLSEASSSQLPMMILRLAWRTYILNSVSAIVKNSVSDSDLDEKMVPDLLEFKTKAEEIIGTAFVKKEGKRDTEFTQALSEGFASGFKARRSKPAEMLAKYLDGMMRKGQAKFSESLSKSKSKSKSPSAANAINSQNAQDALFQSRLVQVLSLYRFSEDKDVFRTFYHRQLAKRLLLGRSASSDAEAGMLRMMKEQYDSEFDMGEIMFKDLSLSAEMMGDFRNSEIMRRHHEYNDNLEVRILQRSAWPFALAKNQILITDEMQNQLSTFSEYYKQKHKNRKLDWDHALGTMSIKTRFQPENQNAVEKELSVSLYQGITLLMFQEKDKISFAEIREAQPTFDDDELRRTLQSLACGKKKILLKSPPGRDVHDEDEFRFNDDFVSTEEGKKAGYRIHVNSIQAKVSVKESVTTNKSIQDDRKHLLDAAIVRIMKAQKQMKYSDLQIQTIEVVKKHFAPQVEEIKQRVESLVEGEYLERVIGEKAVFRYLA